MNLGRKVILFLLFFPLFGVHFAFAETDSVTKLVFVTEEQFVKTGQISAEIMIQTQNANSEAEKVSETNDIEFKTTSNTGQFINASGNPVTTTMSKNTSSRTFYYKDSSEGVYTLTVSIKGRETGKTFSASQSIVVGSSASVQTSRTTSAVNTSNQSSSVSSANSSHSGQESISKFDEKQTFKTDIGRSRVVSINTPVDFEVNIQGEEKESKKVRDPKFVWSFGDGTSIRGREATHVYMFPGDYVVVLNAVQGNKKSVSRVDIKVVDPEVEIKSVKQGDISFVELTNNSDLEVNVGNWVLTNNNQKFVIAPDTLVKPDVTIKIPFIVNDLKNILLSFPTGVVAFEYEGGRDESQVALKPMGSPEERTAMLRQLVALKKELELRQGEPSGLQAEDPGFVVEGAPYSVTEPESSESEIRDQSALLIKAFDEQKEEGSIKRMGKGIANFFKGLFDGE